MSLLNFLPDMFKKTKKAQKTKKENNTNGVEEELSFTVYKMPKNYKIGRFSDKKNIDISSLEKEVKFSSPKKESMFAAKSSSASSNYDYQPKRKKTGIILLFLGLLFLAFLVYIMISYVVSPNFSLTNIFNLGSNKSNLEQQSLGGKDIANIINGNIDNNLDEINNSKPNLDEDLFNDEEALSIDEEDLVLTDDIIESDGILENEGEASEDVKAFEFLDSDGDGLSDEEEMLLGSDKLNVDSDGDGYSDLEELKNLYNPTGKGKLEENVNIVKFVSKNLNFSFLHPSAWEANALSDDSSIIFPINESSHIQVMVEENTEKQNIRAWYANRFFELMDEGVLIKNNNWQGLYSSDKTAFYFTDNNFKNVYTILYSTPSGQENIFYNIFNMMIKSFTLK